MKIADRLVQSGDFIFRWRSYLPLALVPLFAIAVTEARHPLEAPAWDRVWQTGFLVVSLGGLLLRVYTVGTAPAGTSERSTVDPRASVLNTSGPYSIVRHPLYLGNTLIAVGLAGATGAWYLPLVVLLAACLYHERIAAREEAFLEVKFGAQFLEWVARVPAFVPRPGGFQPAGVRFRWREVLAREVHALTVVVAGFFLIESARLSAASGRVVLDAAWTRLVVPVLALFVAVIATKKLTRVLRED